MSWPRTKEKFTLYTNDSLRLLTLFRGEEGFNRWTPWTPLICLWYSFSPREPVVGGQSVRGALILNCVECGVEGNPTAFHPINPHICRICVSSRLHKVSFNIYEPCTRSVKASCVPKSKFNPIHFNWTALFHMRDFKVSHKIPKEIKMTWSANRIKLC